MHLGHVRNNLLGYSVAEILKASGKKSTKRKLSTIEEFISANRCWQEKFGNGETPETSGLKGDKLVGKYYVEFDKAYKNEINGLIEAGKTRRRSQKTEANHH